MWMLIRDDDAWCNNQSLTRSSSRRRHTPVVWCVSYVTREPTTKMAFSISPLLCCLSIGCVRFCTVRLFQERSYNRSSLSLSRARVTCILVACFDRCFRSFVSLALLSLFTPRPNARYMTTRRIALFGYLVYPADWLERRGWVVARDRNTENGGKGRALARVSAPFFPARDPLFLAPSVCPTLSRSPLFTAIFPFEGACNYPLARVTTATDCDVLRCRSRRAAMCRTPAMRAAYWLAGVTWYAATPPHSLVRRTGASAPSGERASERRSSTPSTLHGRMHSRLYFTQPPPFVYPFRAFAKFPCGSAAVYAASRTLYSANFPKRKVRRYSSRL